MNGWQLATVVTNIGKEQKTEYRNQLTQETYSKTMSIECNPEESEEYDGNDYGAE